MDSYKGKNLADTVSTAGSMVLFLLFAVCMLIIIATAAGAYSRIRSSFSGTFNTSAAIRYISNKIRSCDECEIAEDSIILRSESISCIIWCENGGLYEKSFLGDIPEKSGGDKVFDADSLEISDDGELYSISVTCGSDSRSAKLRRR